MTTTLDPAALSPGSPVAVAGVSARAAAASLRRAGLEPWCVDAFCDRDLKQIAHRAAPCTEKYPQGLVTALNKFALPARTPLVLTGAMENHPAVVEQLASHFSLVTSAPGASAAARDPLLSQNLPAISDLYWPQTRPGPIADLQFPKEEHWLIKPMRSGAGLGIKLAQPGISVDDAHIAQQLIHGIPCSALFVVPIAGAFAGRAVLLGATWQLVGDPTFGVKGFRYVGNLGPLQLPPLHATALAALGKALVAQCGLCGIFGVDFVVNPKGQLHVIEVNPRYIASLEVLEDAQGFSAFSLLRGEPLKTRRGSHPVYGKAIVTATKAGVANDLYKIFDKTAVADVPEVGQTVAPGQPICTVFARGATVAECMADLRAMAQAVYTRGLT